MTELEAYEAMREAYIKAVCEIARAEFALDSALVACHRFAQGKEESNAVVRAQLTLDQTDILLKEILREAIDALDVVDFQAVIECYGNFRKRFSIYAPRSAEPEETQAS